jgi:hypothetical protein
VLAIKNITETLLADSHPCDAAWWTVTELLVSFFVPHRRGMMGIYSNCLTGLPPEYRDFSQDGHALSFESTPLMPRGYLGSNHNALELALTSL